MYTEGQIVLLNHEVESKEEIIELLSKKLQEKGYVADSFANAVLEREKEFPTGLNVNGLGVAIPHTDAENVKKPQLAFATLKNPVIFQNMVNIEEEIHVSLVFMLAIQKSNDQVVMLQKLIEIFQNKEIMEQLQQTKKESEFIEIIRQAGIR